MTAADSIKWVEDYLVRTRAAMSVGVLNISQTEKQAKAIVEAESQNAEWERWIDRADYHYFVARILFASSAYLYGFFCAHQCVECYLKGFIRSTGAVPKMTHVLGELLKTARNESADTTSFLYKETAETICMKYEPFYEFVRYPVHNIRPRGGLYVWAGGADETILDYFVYSMRTALPQKQSAWDLLSPQGHFELHHVRDRHSEVFELFKRENINFP